MVITWMQVFNNTKPCGLWHRWWNMFLHICLCMMIRIYIFGKYLLGWCSFQCYCCFTVSECHVCTTNNMPYYTMPVWHVAVCRCIQIRCTPPSSLNWVLQSPTTPRYRALLHHVSLTCGRVQTYQGQICTPCQSTLVLQSPTTPCQFDMWKHADIPRSDVSPCSLHLVLQSPTTLCQYEMWKNACIPRSDLHPPLIEPSATEPYYTMSVWHVAECRCTQVRCTPPHTLNLVLQSSATPCQFDMWQNTDELR